MSYIALEVIEEYTKIELDSKYRKEKTVEVRGRTVTEHGFGRGYTYSILLRGQTLGIKITEEGTAAVAVREGNIL